MKTTKMVNLGLWILISLNLLMSFVAIWVFTRMTPAIKQILERNENSLQACEIMLVDLATYTEDKNTTELHNIILEFEKALQMAQENTTQSDERQIINDIKNNYNYFFKENQPIKNKLISSIRYLLKINRKSMAASDYQARQLGHAGAWGIVFMSTTIFITGLLLFKSLNKNIMTPLNEISETLLAQKNGDIHRRCSGVNIPTDIQRVCGNINSLLDKEKIPLPLEKD